MKPMNYATRLQQRVTATAEWISQKSQSLRFGLSPASGLGTVLVLASLTLVSGPVQASGHASAGVSCAVDCGHDHHTEAHVEAHLQIGNFEIGGEWHNVVPVPRDGLEVQLWSDPHPDNYVEIGDRARFYFEANADCYVTLVSIGTDGRARRIFPGRGDGYVRGGKTYALPSRRSDYDLRFAGPAGEEYVFAVASLYPIRDRFPRWMEEGVGGRWHDNYWDSEDIFWRTGWSVGDPIHDLYSFVDRVVRYPRDYESYAASWLRFDVGWRRPDCYSVCSVCNHSTIWGDFYCDHHSYVSVTIDLGSGYCDFRDPPKPRWKRRWYSPRNPYWKKHKYRYTHDGYNPEKPGHVYASPRRDHVQDHKDKPKGWDRVKGKRHVDEWLADDRREKRDRDRDRKDRDRYNDQDQDRDDKNRDRNIDRKKDRRQTIRKDRGAKEIQKSIRRDSRDLASEESRRAQDRVKAHRSNERKAERKVERRAPSKPRLESKSTPNSRNKSKSKAKIESRTESRSTAKAKSRATVESRTESKSKSKSKSKAKVESSSKKSKSSSEARSSSSKSRSGKSTSAKKSNSGSTKKKSSRRSR